MWDDACSCATGGGSRNGGVLVPLGSAVPWGDSPKLPGGPWATPPGGDYPFETLFVWCLFVVRCFLGLCVVTGVGFMVFGVEMLFGLVPFKTRFLLAWCLCRRRRSCFFLSLSLSHTLGKPKPRLGFGFRFVFSSSWTRTTSSIRTLCSTYTSRPRSRTCCFFFSSALAWVVLWSWSRCLVLVGLVVVVFACACRRYPCIPRLGQKDKTPFAPFRFTIMMVFWGCGGGPISRVSPLRHRFGLPPPTLFLQNAVKDSPGKGWDGNNIVTQFLASFLLPQGGNVVRFFSFCFFGVWSGVFCRFSSFLLSKGRFSEKFSGANFCFWVVVLVLCFFWWVFVIVFALFFGGSLPKLFGKTLSMSGLVFSVVVLSFLGFFVDVVCFFF